MNEHELSTETLRELARRVRSQLPEGVFYCLLVWPIGEPEDVAYFSNAHRAEAVVAMESLLGTVREQGD
jgi:hypothetical protein